MAVNNGGKLVDVQNGTPRFSVEEINLVVNVITEQSISGSIIKVIFFKKTEHIGGAWKIHRIVYSVWTLQGME